MPTFQYEAMNASGQPQKGTIEAANHEDALQRIKSKGFFPTTVREKKVKKKGGSAKSSAAAGGGRKKKAGEITLPSIGGVKKKIITQFSRQMSTLQDAGLPILRSLQILAEQQKPGQFKNVLEDVAVEVEGGSALSEAMAKHPKAFDRLYTKMIAAGEVGGVLDIIMQRLADFMEKAETLKRRIKGAMFYPATVLVIAVAIVIFIMVAVVPKFKQIFADFDTELPAITTNLIATSEWMAGREQDVIPGWLIIISVPFILFFVLKIVNKSKAGKKVTDRVKSKLPIMGRLSKAGSIARFTRTLGTLITAGVPILEAIAITRDTVGNSIYENALQKVHDSIREGESFAGPLRETKVVDLLVVNMIDVGEETGELDKMLYKVADQYDEEVDNLVKSMMSMLEPLMIVVLGLVVGGIVVALFAPIPALINGVMNA